MENRNPTGIQLKETRGILTALWQSPEPQGSQAVGMSWGAAGETRAQTHRSCAGRGPLAAHSLWEERCFLLPRMVQEDPRVRLTQSCLHSEDKAAEIRGEPTAGAGVRGKAPHLPRVPILLPCLPLTPESQRRSATHVALSSPFDRFLHRQST